MNSTQQLCTDLLHLLLIAAFPFTLCVINAGVIGALKSVQTEVGARFHLTLFEFDCLSSQCLLAPKGHTDVTDVGSR